MIAVFVIVRKKREASPQSIKASFFILISQNTGSQNLTQILSILNRASLKKSDDYFVFRPNVYQYVPVRKNMSVLRDIRCKIGTEQGELINIAPGSGETRLSLHLISEDYLKRY